MSDWKMKFHMGQRVRHATRDDVGLVVSANHPLYLILWDSCPSGLDERGYSHAEDLMPFIYGRDEE